ncbi:15204_t:CDS:2 [Gigaspora rosea]|nr:15204_t:CDS:2 [Gigaspora rosea]
MRLYSRLLADLKPIFSLTTALSADPHVHFWSKRTYRAGASTSTLSIYKCIRTNIENHYSYRVIHRQIVSKHRKRSSNRRFNPFCCGFATEINWTNKLNEYKNVFALSTEDFKKFAITQDDKVSKKDKEIAQLLKTNASINEVAKEMLIEQEFGCQDYSLMKITNKMSNLELEKQSRIQKLEKKIEEKTEHESLPSSTNNNSIQYQSIWAQGETQHKNMVHTFTLWDIPSEASPGRGTRKAAVFEIKFKNKKRLVCKEAGQAMIQNVNLYSKRIKVVEKEKDGSNIDTSVNSHKQMATGNQQEKKLKEHRQESSNNKNYSTVTSINKKKGKAKQANGKEKRITKF